VDGALSTGDGGFTVINQTVSPVLGAGGTNVLTVAAPGGFNSGNVIFLHQSQGTGAGAWELNGIASVDGGTVVTLSPLAHTYTTGSASHAQVVQVPQYTTVDVTAHTLLSAPAWNGSVGGILVLLAQTSVSVEGSLAMDGSGFQGGVSTPPGNRGYSGESELGASVPTTKANNASGGGGGGDCSASVAGSGGHAIAGTASADTQNCIGVQGAASSDLPDLSLMLFGGGGGGAGNDLATPSLPGGAGGGIVFVVTPMLNVTGAISANGNAGASAVTTSGTACTYDGLSGNGAGGAIYLNAASGTLSTEILAVGGQSVTVPCGSTDSVTNGTGGDGRIHLTGGITGTTTPAAQ
jgi:hypothetical protein